jgi:hypothetical protein
VPKKPSKLNVATTTSPNRRVFTHTQLIEFLEKGAGKSHVHYDPRRPKITEKQLVELAIASGQVVRHEFKTLHRCGPRYTLADASVYELLRSLRPKGYLSHHSAAYAHGLTTGVPNVTYWNDEQSPKPRPQTPPNQARIDMAFAGRPRKSNNSASYESQEICILSGMNTARLGVVEQVMPDGAVGPVTDLERTLIDLAVRPAYGGGPSEVLACYKQAAPRVSAKRLKRLLAKLNYVYPYHQAVGFYLDRAGVPGAEELRSIPQHFDFYLAHELKKRAYCPKWRIHYPAKL